METNDFWDIPLVPDAKPERKQREPGEPSGDGTMAKLYTKHPEGGGPYGGRDNALTAYIGYLRSTGIDYDSAYPAAVAWNLQWCDPPMDEADVAFKAGRAWSDWPESDREPLTPAMLREQLAAKVQPKRKLEFLNWQAFCDLAAQADDAQWLVENLITRGGMHFITAPPGGGKSWIAVDLVRACNDGSNWMGCLPVTKCNILYINEEMGIGRFFQRFFKLSPGACENVHIMQKQMVKLDNAEHMAHFFFGVCDELKRQLKLGLEFVMRLHVVTGDAKHGGAGFDEILVLVTELHGFRGATRGIVFGVKIQNNNFAQVGLVGNFEPARGDSFKFGERFVNDDCHTA